MPAFARAILIQESAEGGLSYKVKKIQDFPESQIIGFVPSKPHTVNTFFIRVSQTI